MLEAARRAEAALRENEEQGRLLLEAATDYAIFTTDIHRVITSWSAGAAAIFGWSASEIIGERADILFTPEDRVADAPEHEAANATESGCAPDARWHLRKDGSRFFAEGSVRPLHFADGRLRGFLKVARDATERHRMEELLRERVRLQETLMREVSHRVKNSLAMVAGLLSLQARASCEVHVRRALMEAEDRVITIAQVHDQLWRQADMEHIDLAAFLGEICAKLQDQAPNHDVVFDSVSVTVPADRAIALGLIVNELVTNALKYAYPVGSGGEIRVQLCKGEGAIRLEVVDRGAGLPTGLDLSGSSSSLGMRVVQGLARQLGATLRTSSAEPGARFTIEFSHG